MEQLGHERIVQFIRHEVLKDPEGININSISYLLFIYFFIFEDYFNKNCYYQFSLLL